MESTTIETLRQEWQSAVRAYAGLVRDGRMSRLSAEEMSELSGVYLLRIDSAFARLKRAEEQQTAVAAT